MIFEVGAGERGHFIAAEYVEGRTLRAAMARGLAVSEALGVASQIAAALSAAHAAGVVHRDIKPENVMLRSDGYVKVLDFGLAKLTESAPARDAAPSAARFSTEAGLVMGTVSYMSPEQARGLEVDARTDIFSLGVVLYEMLTGQPPFAGETPSDVLAAILKTEPPALCAAAPGVPAELQSVVTRALRKDRAARYQTAGEMLADLNRIKQRVEWEAGQGGRDSSDTLIELPAPGQVTDKLTEPRAQSSAEYLIGGIKKHKLAAAVALALLLLAAAAAYFLTRSRGGAVESIDSIAVLPFTNAGGVEDAEYLADGIADSLIGRLSQLSHLRVMSLNSVLRYKGREVDARAVGDELGVRAVLVSRFRQQGENLIVTTELVDAGDRRRLWGRQYTRRLADVIALQALVAQEVSAHLRLPLSGAERRRLARRETESDVAYQLYLKGRYRWNMRSEEHFKRAIEYFNQAIAADPSYALAYAGLADCYGLLANYGGTPPGEAMPRAKAAAERALALDATLAEAHTSLGLVRRDFEWDAAGAERDFRRAIELNPNYATAWQFQAETLVRLKRFDEAAAAMERARALDPLSPIINGEVGWVYYHARQHERAMAELRRALALDPQFARTHSFLGRVHAARREDELSIAATREALRLSNDYPLFLAALGHTHATFGRRAEAARVLDELHARARREYVSPFAFALVAAGLGNPDAAFAWLEKSVAERDTILVNYVRDPQLDGLRDDPRFAALLARLGLAP
jgi:eukaryotic-like serine/threonine-protein kinase